MGRSCPQVSRSEPVDGTISFGPLDDRSRWNTPLVGLQPPSLRCNNHLQFCPSQPREMAREKILFEKNGLELFGLFQRGARAQALPLIVLIHGGGATTAFFDNSVISEKGHAGLILVGHSIGGAIALSIAHEAQGRLPIFGVSAMGCLPTLAPLRLLPEVDPEPENPRFVVDNNPENVRRFMGRTEWLNLDALSADIVSTVFEPGIKAEIKEYQTSDLYEYLVARVFPGIRVPVQYLAAEAEVLWDDEEQGRPIFDTLVSHFKNASEIDSAILPRGGHNYEFSKSVDILLDRRNEFVRKLSTRFERTNGETTIQVPFTNVPILDYAQTASASTRATFLTALKNAIVNVGFFYLKNTGVPDELYRDLAEQSIALFNLPLEKKLEIEMVNSKHFLGYARLGQEVTALRSDYREQFDFATELPAPGPEEPLYRNIRGPNQWPDAEVLPSFRSTIEHYLESIETLSNSFKALVAEALELPSNAFDQFFDSPQQNKLKLIKYPEPVDAQTDEDTQGVGPHKDSCFLTFLLQGTPHTGLEVQNKAGTWLPVKPIPGTLVINIGRALEAITGGVCTATTHRVNLRRENYLDADGQSLGPRLSFAVFQGVSLDLGVEKIHIRIPQHIKELVQDEKVRSDAEATFNEMFNGNIGEGTLIARITSHQDVAQRWYPDLLQQALKAQSDKHR
ncbi:oxidoreductase [Penicillium canariense]|uniref:Oxidoreductase n=1 Tax=Penicillium canariense TaxID=189055 RepID=A0A9W9LTB4_9EURO|nr:oxidoreductase [Penicillium canariense]KAJ5175968.1 oxidoreductase [Penicillium canariense]